MLLLFTSAEAYIIAYLSLPYSEELVLQAILLTVSLVAGLTLYAITTSSDYTACGAMAFGMLVILMVFGLLTFLFGPTVKLVYCLCGVAVLGFYIVMDT